MAAFHEIQFPPSISEGAIGGPRFSTSVMTLSSGGEHRNINWLNARGEWDVAHAMKTREDANALIAFFRARFGKAYGFRFKDWTDYRLPDWINDPGDLLPIPTLFTTNGTLATFQLVKGYADTVNPYVRPIYKPVAGSLVLFVNGSVSTDFSVNTATGIVTLGGTTAALSGAVITGYCEFDTPVRFDTDDMKVQVTTIDNYAWQPIPIVETREIA